MSSKLTCESLDLNGGDDEVVQGEFPLAGIVLGEQVLDESWGETVSHLLESWNCKRNSLGEKAFIKQSRQKKKPMNNKN